MGKHFGELYHMRNIITYRLSPFEQRAFANVISKSIGNTFRRFRESVFYVVPPLVGAYVIYDAVEREHDRLMRKNPADFENER
ncbi:cytochrome b-c1 complex subunit 8 [Agrilus planipennis]|uniref:Cytochrome b-c1 complex subunit 8 n=1 Tax=Agrilus planipennis TaxID=224129 RepID=A0A1W4X507_AGRPL|nr:cytochrome b-c1 complex subunit 8 [Agrilus planipennis]